MKRALLCPTHSNGSAYVCDFRIWHKALLSGVKRTFGSVAAMRWKLSVIQSAAFLVNSEQAALAVRIKMLFNLALNRVGEFAACTLEVAGDFVLGLPQL